MEITKGQCIESKRERYEKDVEIETETKTERQKELY